MARSAGRAHGSKVKVTISLDPKIYAWAMANSKPGGRFASVSHAIEHALARLRDEEK